MEGIMEFIRCGRCDGMFVSRPGYAAHRLENPMKGRICKTIDERFADGMSRDPMGYWLAPGDSPMIEVGSRLRHPSSRAS